MTDFFFYKASDSWVKSSIYIKETPSHHLLPVSYIRSMSVNVPKSSCAQITTADLDQDGVLCRTACVGAGVQDIKDKSR